MAPQPHEPSQNVRIQLPSHDQTRIDHGTLLHADRLLFPEWWAAQGREPRSLRARFFGVHHWVSGQNVDWRPQLQPLLRYALPIHKVVTFSKPRVVDVEAIGKAVVTLADEAGAAWWQATALHQAVKPSLTGLTEKLSLLAPKLRPTLHGHLPTAHQNVVVCAIIGDRALLGAVAPAEAGSLWPLAQSPHDWLGRKPFPWRTRAAVKWLEGADLFRLYAPGISIETPRHWLELGAAPGGITDVLLQNAESRVTAIDVAPLASSLQANPRVQCFQAAAGEVRPAGPFGGLICDINGEPSLALAAVAHHLPSVTPHSPVFFTLKLPVWAHWQVELAEAHRVFHSLGLDVICVRHLVANKGEVTILALKK